MFIEKTFRCYVNNSCFVNNVVPDQCNKTSCQLSQHKHGHLKHTHVSMEICVQQHDGTCQSVDAVWKRDRLLNTGAAQTDGL